MLFGDRYEYGVRQIVDPNKAIAIYFAIMAVCIIIFYYSVDISQPLVSNHILILYRIL